MIEDPAIELPPVDGNKIARDLMDVARVALGSSMPQLGAEDGLPLLKALLAVIEARMPADLATQDPRVREARLIVGLVDAAEME